MKEKKKQNFFFGCLISFSAFVILFILLVALVPDESYTDYTNSRYGFSMQYPSSWTVIDQVTPPVMVQFASPQSSEVDNITENVNIVYFDLSRKRYKDLNSFSKTTVDQLVGAFGEFVTVLDNKPISFGGLPGHCLSYIGRSEAGNPDRIQLKYLHAWTVRGDYAYILTYAGEKDEFNENLPSVEAMIRSFRFEK